MSSRFDRIAKVLASPMPRGQAFKVVALSILAPAVATRIEPVFACTNEPPPPTATPEAGSNELLVTGLAALAGGAFLRRHLRKGTRGDNEATTPTAS